MILVTRNTKDFEHIAKVSNLMLENWFEAWPNPYFAILKIFRFCEIRFAFLNFYWFCEIEDI
jgi:hypothetical protein